MASSVPPPSWKIPQSALNIDRDNMLGNGSNSVVFHARWHRANDEVLDVAAKVLKNQDVNPSELTTLFKISINPHPNIIKFYGAVRSEKDIDTIIVTELARKGSLYDYLKEMKESNERLSTKQILTWALEGALAIKHLHDSDVTHRDIKSPNFLIMEDMTMKLCDFGISTLDGSGTKTTGNAKGTQRWKAPELFFGKVSNKSDIFSFGTVIWEMITCEEPYHQCKFDGEVMQQIISKVPLIIPPNECPEGLKNLVSSCRGDKDARPTIEEIISTVRRLLQQHVQEDTPDSEPIQEIHGGAFTRTQDYGTLDHDASPPLAHRMRKMTMGDDSETKNFLPVSAHLDRRSWTDLLRIPKVRERVRDEIVPSSVIHHLSSVVDLSQEQQVKAREQAKGSISAADLLIDILLSCADENWPEIFLVALEKEKPVLAEFLTTEMKTLLKGGVPTVVRPREEPQPGQAPFSGSDYSFNVAVNTISDRNDTQRPDYTSHPDYEKHLQALSDDLDFEFVAKESKPKDAKRLYRHLNLEISTVEQIKHDNRDMGSMEVTVAVLQKWRSKNGRHATRKSLLSACRSSEIRDVADKLESKWGAEFMRQKSNSSS